MKKKRLSSSINEEVIIQLRILALEKRITLTELIEKILTDYLANQE